MKLSSKSHYGLIAVNLLAKNYNKQAVSATALEKAISVSGKYIEQIMRLLIKRNIVVGSRGANGGYSLARAPEEISVGEIVRALENDMKIIECLDGNGNCKCCPSSMVWKKLYKGINEILDGITLKQMTDGEI